MKIIRNTTYRRPVRFRLTDVLVIAGGLVVWFEFCWQAARLALR